MKTKIEKQKRGVCCKCGRKRYIRYLTYNFLGKSHLSYTELWHHYPRVDSRYCISKCIPFSS